MIDPPFCDGAKIHKFLNLCTIIENFVGFRLIFVRFYPFLFVFWIELFDEKKQEKTKNAPE